MDQDILQQTACVRFLHPVGQSTLNQGLTIPIGAQTSWLMDIKKGESVRVAIDFGARQKVEAVLRRINNAVGHLQFRYESKNQSPLRHFLRQRFGEVPDTKHAVLEVRQVGPRTFQFNPISAIENETSYLSVYKPQLHSITADYLQKDSEFQELKMCLSSITYNAEYSQSQYNQRIGQLLSARGWKGEARVLDALGLRCDFEKNGVWLEVEFGNARAYYQDYIKFSLAAHHRKARFGILLSPTRAFAELLCELGQKRASAKREAKDTRIPSYSGMMSYEKAVKELPYIKFLLVGPTVIAGIDIAQAGAS